MPKREKRRRKRRLPIGAEYFPLQGTHFRIFAPDHKKATLVLKQGKTQQMLSMHKEPNGYFSIFVSQARAGMLYAFRLSLSKKEFPDPASRFQSFGPEGPSCIVDSSFHWTDRKWKGIHLENQILYEMHIGTFTQEGTFRAAMKLLPDLAKLGITTIEVMPIHDFPGKFGWGYDGVQLFAPKSNYGSPEDVKAFINQAHQFKLGVILDIVYNHLGPESNSLIQFSKDYFDSSQKNDWGDQIHFDYPPVREFFIANAQYWIEEFHFDGFRMDAIPWIKCSTPKHVLAEISEGARKAAGKKSIILIGEDETQNINYIKPIREGGCNLDGLTNEDFHHSTHVRLTGNREAYYNDYLGSSQELLSSLKHNYLYQGQYYKWKNKEHGSSSLNMPGYRFISFLENHDQVANSNFGKRLYTHVDRENWKAMTCLLLLGPHTPLLFQGQEFGSSRPFFFFSDHNKELQEKIRKGRMQLIAHSSRGNTKEAQAKWPNPSDINTFNQCKLDFTEKKKNKELFFLHQDLINLRKKDSLFKKMHRTRIEGAIINPDSFIVRYFGEKEPDRLLIINFGIDYEFSPLPEPLFAPGEGMQWEVIFSTASTRYGGEGSPSFSSIFPKILGHTAIVLKARKNVKQA